MFPDPLNAEPMTPVEPEGTSRDGGAEGRLKTLILMRHAKSDWSVPVDDRRRPLNERGRRQAAEAGRWLRTFLDARGEPLELAVVSPAVRAAYAWDLAAAELDEAPPVRREELAYTFDGDDLHEVVRGLPGDVDTVVLVGHNPACEELLDRLLEDGAGEITPQMKTSALAVIELADWTSRGRLVAHGRPPN
ncbi:SixA phosphatase family protein [Ornithinimicrobium sp. Y1847]|uniref:SixA phosphatase family protein n=1 Tax=Ornithinimicrobium sp. Y1847 TaxID=3405419 RepID=UPI003B66D633